MVFDGVCDLVICITKRFSFRVNLKTINVRNANFHVRNTYIHVNSFEFQKGLNVSIREKIVLLRIKSHKGSLTFSKINNQ